VFGTDVTQQGSSTQLGNRNDFGFRLNGFPSCPSSPSFGPSGDCAWACHARSNVRAELSRSVEERSRKQASSATRGKKEHFCDRYHIASATAALGGAECSGGVNSEHFWIDGERLWAATKAPQRGKGRAVPERRSSIRVPSLRCAQPVFTDGWRTVGGGS